MPRARYSADVPTLDDESTPDSDTDSLFDDEADSGTDTDLDSLLIEEDTDNDDDLFDDEVRHPPGHYRANAANLDVQRLRKKRYSPKTQIQLDRVKEHHDQYCTFQTWDPAKCYDEISPQFIHGFLSRVCDQRRGKGGRRRPGIKYASSLETFWKCYLIVYKIETGRKIDPMIQVNDMNEFKNPEIIYDPTLVLSPHVFLLGMLFKARAFKSPSIDYPQRLYSLKVLKGLNKPPLLLRDEMNNEFIFCEALSSRSVQYRMKVGGEITGFRQVLKPYNLRDSSAKGLNKSPDGVYRRLDTQKDLMRFACSISRSIDPRRPRKLTPEQTCLHKRVNDLSNAPVGSRKDNRLQKAIKRLYNEKQRKRRELLKDIKVHEQQLSGIVVDEDTRDALVRADMSPEQLGLIDAILTLPGKSPEQELQRRITAINAVTLYCSVEEGAPSRHVRRSPPGTLVSPPVQAAEPDIALRKAISSIRTDKRPKVCFVCIGTPHLTIGERVAEYANPGSLSRHFQRYHVSKLQVGQFINCMDCGVRLKTRKELLIHAERFHGTVSRVPAERLIV
ncbi:hypothetical protein BKA64DRAFT_698284 [Cadophora sp. MPI-SDFR-AT-0126]|nr:hypothetical protein BKA64DRAFT_698284 [Leotiomycetes sp. MPI-SDFR-AT-0126]